ncbi:uncharacterized protein BCR38DRAFT_395282 [Pseudomassariella vexata]|uniref:Histone transcription regulator 3 homolog n=1 Tax=Pseudomassariella vexata TaxID=1141098 RepID=A0A1Y2DSZ3_9PEZI|nr:uncharacterized protein BCR38DRAFT_395282 [Pseudomassariella vexata]ORY62393.1 hypothetical protein BCR38DRAFT_395282 [Pseudomassariella vexata]
MPVFAAINVELEENIDDEVDNTREIHIDEALKRFQTALKLHSLGPRHYAEASEAYSSLFESDIFGYPDSATEFERAELQTDPRHLPLDLSFAQSLDASQADIDGSGSSLPQALYLSYKNHGQFELDGIRHQAKIAGPDAGSVFEQKETREKAYKALYDFSAALDHDPSDAELWRRAARVAAFLQSARTSRYCLEAAIELDDDPAVEEVEPPSLAEGFAGEQLKDHLETLMDDVALTHPIMAPYTQRSMPTQLKKYIDPIPFLPNPTKELAVPQPTPVSGDQQDVRPVLKPTETSWADLGMAIVHSVVANGLAACAVSIELPDISETPEPIQQTLVERLKPNALEDAEAPGGEEDPSRTISPGVRMEFPEETKTEAATIPENSKTERSGSLSRKRSQSTAGLNDGDIEEVVEKRSKRTRRRETAAEESVDTQTLFAAQLEPYQAADKNLFQTARNMAENLGVTDRAAMDRLGELVELSAFDNRTARITGAAMTDLRDSLVSFEEDTARILLSKKEASSFSFASFLEHSQPASQHKSDTPIFDESKGLRGFAHKVNAGWIGITDVAFEWVREVSLSYLDYRWSDTMKISVVQVISHLDEDIFTRMQHELQRWQCAPDPDRTLQDVARMVQVLFELHLDVYERITNPNSAVDFSIRVETKGRLGRWFSFAARMSREIPVASDKALTVRFLWAAVFHVTITEGASRDHVLQCWQSLRDSLSTDYEGIILRLPNNAILPEISTQAADREISKLTTMDFFLGLFQDNLNDPVSVIDSLEPVLNPNSVYSTAAGSQSPPMDSPITDGQLEPTSSECPKAPVQDAQPIMVNASQGLRDLWKFLLGASTELRLFLWTRLGDAYYAIKYTTKKFSCNLRSIEMIVDDFERDPYISLPIEERRALSMKMLKFLDDILIQSLSLARDDSSAFDIFDEDHLKSSIAALMKLSSILHTAFMFEDEVRVGMTSAPTGNSTFSSFLNKLREMQVRNWSLLYKFLKTGISQNKSMFSNPETDLADYLAAAHQVLGLRKCCKASDKIFLEMMREELLKQNLVDNWEDYLGQVLYDLYGLKLGVGIWEVQDHGCPSEKLERRNTVALVDKISVLANRMPMKDLLKSDLKTTIEHMQQAIGQTKSNQQTIHNLRHFTEYLKKPIHPLRLYQALRGKVTIDAVAVNTPDSSLAKHGWFFRLGMIAFCKFKGVDLNRRQTPGALDDLRMGATFLRQQLQFTPDRWDAWFRLAECFDYELDESVLWTADKMNKERAELVKFQRSAIHCYALALSHSWKALPQADDETMEAIHELYHKFGMRMYASSREPFAMEPFQHSDQERFFIQNNMGAGTFKKIVHKQMQDYKVWKYAANLFRRAMKIKPKEWKNSYMLAKCVWKMYQKSPDALDESDRKSQPTLKDVIDALEISIGAVVALPKPRHGQDPILEPHYKIVSIIHKLVLRSDLGLQEAADTLQRQPYAIKDGQHVEMTEPEDWEPYVIQALTHLREKDKSNWQHRIAIRHARILFDESEDPSQLQAMAASGVLQKTMFTKTMVMNIWKCDAERPGRHHVYTEQYVRFMVKLLVRLKDRTNFEPLLRRLRKKGADFYHFNDLWQTCVLAYLRLIRQGFDIEPVLDDVYKNMSPDEFEIIASRINEWSISGEDGSEKHPAFSALKEAIELKKLNSGLMKASPIDDLINDAYTALYLEVGNSLPGPSPQSIIQDRKRERQAAIQIDGTGDSKPNPFGNILNPQSEQNSGTEGPGVAPAKETEGVTSRSRRAIVRRPDILRKAEQAVTRALEGPAKSAREKSVRASVSSGKTRNSGSQTPTVDGKAGGVDEDDVEMKNGDAHDGGSSAASSVRDEAEDRDDRFDADDESDLSDVPDEDLLDEDEQAQLMFPNLLPRHAVSDSGEEEHQEEEEADDEDEDHDGEEAEEIGGEDDMEDDGDEEVHEHDEEHDSEQQEEDEELEEEEDDEGADDTRDEVIVGVNTIVRIPPLVEEMEE